MTNLSSDTVMNSLIDILPPMYTDEIDVIGFNSFPYLSFNLTIYFFINYLSKYPIALDKDSPKLSGFCARPPGTGNPEGVGWQ